MQVLRKSCEKLLWLSRQDKCEVGQNKGCNPARNAYSGRVLPWERSIRGLDNGSAIMGGARRQGRVMLRVSGGVIRGRRILAPGDRIRPTQEKVRQALFSSLMHQVSGCRFLDLFAGAGTVGLEAWSRGADFVCWVEKDPRTASLLRENVTSLCVPGNGIEHGACGGKTRVITTDAARFIQKDRGDAPFNIIFADPPYDDSLRNDWPRKILQVVMASSILAENGVLVIETRAGEPFPECDWVPVKEKVYGGTQLRFWEK